MKLWHCDWVPSSVADWLCRELDERGIPGTTYTYSLFSLLHPFFCPHPVSRERSYLQEGFSNIQDQQPNIESGTHKELQLLFEEIDGFIHPDADFPQLNNPDSSKVSSQHSKRRQNRKKHQLSQSPEKLWKIAALQCLQNASEDLLDLKSVIEELFIRLKDSRKTVENEGTERTCSNHFPQNRNSDQEITESESDKVASDSCHSNSNFPAFADQGLAGKICENGSISNINWQSLLQPNNSVDKIRDIDKINDYIDPCNHDEDKIKGSLITHLKSNKEKKLEMEYSPNSIENETLEDRAYCFLPIVNHDINNASLAGNFGNLRSQPENPRLGEKILVTGKEQLEEWERAGSLLPNPSSRAGSFDSIGSRLFEWLGSSTDVGVVYPDSSVDNARNRTIPHPVDRLWGYPSDDVRESGSGNIWGIPPDISKPPLNENVNSEAVNLSTSFFLPNPNDNIRSDKTIRNNLFDNDVYKACDLQHITSKNNCVDWSSNVTGGWASINHPKYESGFSNAYKDNGQLTYKDPSQNNEKFLSDIMNHENLKGNFPDLNDNTQINNTFSLDANSVALSHDHLLKECEINPPSDSLVSEQVLCESLSQLSLEQMLGKSCRIEDCESENFQRKNSGLMPENDMHDSLSMLDKQSRNLDAFLKMRESSLMSASSDDLTNTEIPVGPNGPYVDLRHTESSGFNAVVPHDRHLSLFTDIHSPQERSLPIAVKEASTTEGLLTTSGQEEENLLTSPRTHFRPIRQDNHVSGDEKSEDGQIATQQTSGDPNAIFQRSGSGGLYLKRDIVDGSPKKYMTFKEQPDRLSKQTVHTSAKDYALLSNCINTASAPFVPKFKLVNNEKFCQTDDSNDSIDKKINIDWNSEIINKLKTSKNNNHWNVRYSKNLKMIWGENPEVNKNEFDETWGFQDIDEHVYPKWSTNDDALEWSKPEEAFKNWHKHDHNRSRDWSKANSSAGEWPQQISKAGDWNKYEEKLTKWPKQEVSFNNWSSRDNRVEDWSKFQEKASKIKQKIYEDSALKPTPKMDSESEDNDTFQKIKFIWHDSMKTNFHSIPDSNTKDSHSNFVPSTEASSLNFASVSDNQSFPFGRKLSDVSVPKSPWNELGIGFSGDGFEIKSEKEEEFMDFASRWKLQREVDQEAEEILGGIYPPSPLKGSPLNGSSTEPSSCASPQKPNTIKIDSSDKLKFLEFLERQDRQPPIEDLDHLEPGWDLNEGFEWGSEAEQIFHCDDEDISQEVLMYEMEDGETVMLPVEYLDDNLYDQIFGSSDHPIGGSLPDLPGGQMGEIKKGNFQLSRRSRGSERFTSHSKRPCSFFLEGNCRRTDCKFSHDLLTITCRFWEEGSCLKGDTCPFRHGIVPSRRRNRSEGDQTSLAEPVTFASLREGGRYSNGSRNKTVPKRNRSAAVSISSFEIDSETDFPCLGSSVESKIGSFDDQNFPHVEMAKLSKKKKKVVTFTENGLKEPENEIQRGTQSRSIKNKRKSKGNYAEENGGATQTKPKKLKDKDDEGNECNSLKKILRKRFFSNTKSSSLYFDDESLSDF